MKIWLFALSFSLLACNRSAVTSADAPAPQLAPAGMPAELKRAAASSVVAIGDLHGDLAAAERVLRLAQLIDADGHWSGGARILVQTGDAIDRGDQDREVLDLLERLGEQARRAGGDVLALSGNHELMNVAHDFRYVSAASFAAFDGPVGRAAAFAPGAPYARMLAHRPMFVQVGDSVFVHGGILKQHLAYGLGRMQREVTAWLKGQAPSPPAVVMAEDGPIWTRLYSAEPDAAACAELAAVLTALSAKRMVVGHTVQPRGVTSACDGRVWRIDVGLSRFYGGPSEALEVAATGPRVLHAPP